MTNFTVILFSNRIAAHGFGFYNDFDEKAVLKNSRGYEFIQENLSGAVAGEPAAAAAGPVPPKF